MMQHLAWSVEWCVPVDMCKFFRPTLSALMLYCSNSCSTTDSLSELLLESLVKTKKMFST